MTQMLMEFEILDKEVIAEIMKGEWDVDRKRFRLNDAHEKHKLSETTSPKPE